MGNIKKRGSLGRERMRGSGEERGEEKKGRTRAVFHLHMCPSTQYSRIRILLVRENFIRMSLPGSA